MKQNYLFVFTALILAVFISCNTNNSNKLKDKSSIDTTQVNEFEVLVNYLENNNNYINSDDFPSIISTQEVLENIGNNKYLILDLREKEAFSLEHIEASINVQMNELIQYFDSKIDYQEYEKIIIVCFSGQNASYATGVLRLLGYNNVYALKFGLGYWNPEIGYSVWGKNTSSDYQDVLDFTNYKKSIKTDHPEINTGYTNPKDILMARAQQILEAGYKNSLVNMTEAYLNGSTYYIINYWDKEKYDAGHLVGAIQYTPKKSLSTDKYLYTLPTDKTIIVYGSTGLDEAFVVAYLNIIGYKAKGLIYGANGFMHEKLVKNNWDPYLKSEVHNYPLVGYLNN